MSVPHAEILYINRKGRFYIFNSQNKKEKSLCCVTVRNEEAFLFLRVAEILLEAVKMAVVYIFHN